MAVEVVAIETAQCDAIRQHNLFEFNRFPFESVFIIIINLLVASCSLASVAYFLLLHIIIIFILINKIQHKLI